MRIASAALALTLLCPAAAAAQMSILRPDLGRDDMGTGDVRDVNAAECAANIVVSLWIVSIPAGRSRLDFWRGGEGEGCNDELKRDGRGDDCDHLDLPGVDLNVTGVQMNPQIPVADLIDCSAMDENFEIFVLAVDSSMTTAAVPEGEWDSLILGLDRLPPSIPTNLRAGQGDTEVPIRWDFPEAEVQPRRFEIYVDRGDLVPVMDGGTADGGGALDAGPTPDGGGALDAGPTPDAGGALDAGPTAIDAGGAAGPAGCPSSVLVPGATIAEGNTYIEANGSAREVTIDPSALGLAVGDTAAVTVIAVDEALNRSAVGEVVCVGRIDTVGLCDRTTCESGCQCSMPGRPARGLPAGLFAASLLLLALRRLGSRP